MVPSGYEKMHERERRVRKKYAKLVKNMYEKSYTQGRSNEETTYNLPEMVGLHQESSLIKPINFFLNYGAFVSRNEGLCFVMRVICE